MRTETSQKDYQMNQVGNLSSVLGNQAYLSIYDRNSAVIQRIAPDDLRKGALYWLAEGVIGKYLDKEDHNFLFRTLNGIEAIGNLEGVTEADDQEKEKKSVLCQLVGMMSAADVSVSLPKDGLFLALLREAEGWNIILAEAGSKKCVLELLCRAFRPEMDLWELFSQTVAVIPKIPADVQPSQYILESLLTIKKYEALRFLCKCCENTLVYPWFEQIGLKMADQCQNPGKKTIHTVAVADYIPEKKVDENGIESIIMKRRYDILLHIVSTNQMRTTLTALRAVLATVEIPAEIQQLLVAAYLKNPSFTIDNFQMLRQLKVSQEGFFSRVWEEEFHTSFLTFQIPPEVVVCLLQVQPQIFDCMMEYIEAQHLFLQFMPLLRQLDLSVSLPAFTTRLRSSLLLLNEADWEEVSKPENRTGTKFWSGSIQFITDYYGHTSMAAGKDLSVFDLDIGNGRKSLIPLIQKPFIIEPKGGDETPVFRRIYKCIQIPYIQFDVPASLKSVESFSEMGVLLQIAQIMNIKKPKSYASVMAEIFEAVPNVKTVHELVEHAMKADFVKEFGEELLSLAATVNIKKVTDSGEELTAKVTIGTTTITRMEYLWIMHYAAYSWKWMETDQTFVAPARAKTMPRKGNDIFNSLDSVCKEMEVTCSDSASACLKSLLRQIKEEKFDEIRRTECRQMLTDMSAAFQKSKTQLRTYLRLISDTVQYIRTSMESAVGYDEKTAAKGFDANHSLQYIFRTRINMLVTFSPEMSCRQIRQNAIRLMEFAVNPSQLIPFMVDLPYIFAGEARKKEERIKMINVLLDQTGLAMAAVARAMYLYADWEEQLLEKARIAPLHEKDPDMHAVDEPKKDDDA